jgi:hypothetical protein
MMRRVAVLAERHDILRRFKNATSVRLAKDFKIR